MSIFHTLFKHKVHDFNESTKNTLPTFFDKSKNNFPLGIAVIGFKVKRKKTTIFCKFLQKKQ